MTKPHSSSFKSSIRDDYRSRRDAARRYDRTEGPEDDFEGEEDVEDDDEGPESPLDSVTRRFNRSNPRYARPQPNARPHDEEEDDGPARRREPAAHLDPDEIAEAAAALVTRRVAASERHTAKAFDNIARMIESGNRRQDESSRLNDALAAVQRRAEASERKTARALESIAELIEFGGKNAHRENFEQLVDRLGRIEQRLAQPATDETRPIRGMLARLESRIDRLSKDDRADHFAQTLSGLDERLSQIAARLTEDARAAAPPPVEPAPGALQRETQSAAAPRSRPLAQAIADIARRQQALEAELRPPRHLEEAGYDAPPRRGLRLDDLRASMDALSRRLEARALEETETRDPQIEALHGHLDGVQRQIDDLAKTSHPDLSMRIEELREAIETQTRQTESLRAEMMQRPDERLAILSQLESLRRETEELACAEKNALARRIDDLRASHEELAQRIDGLRGEQTRRPEQQFLLMRQIEALQKKIVETAELEPARIVERFTQLGDAVARLAQQLVELRSEAGQSAGRQGQLVKQMESLRKEVGDLSRLVSDIAPRASVAAIETALRELTRRVDAQRHRGVRESELAPADHIATELRAALKDLDPAPMLNHLNADVAKITRRLDEMHSGADAPALQELARQTAEIKDSLRLLASRPLPTEKLEKRLADLTERVESLSFKTAAPKAAADMGDVIKSIRSIVATETGASLNAFSQKLERIADKLDAAVAGSGKKRLEELGARIEEMHKSLAQRIDQSAAAQRPATAAALENLVATLAKKIDGALEARADNSAFEELGRKIERLETHIPGAAEAMARIEHLLERPGAEGQFGELAERLEEIGKALTARFEQGLSRTGAEARQFEELAQRLGDRIDAALARGGGRRDLQQVEQQIGVLSKKLDLLADNPATRPAPQSQLNALGQRIDLMHDALAARIDEGARLRAEAGKEELADLVERLAKKIDGALAPGADAGAIAGLEDQIKQVSERLDRNGGAGAALEAIEAKIAELFARLEEAQTGSTAAAEAALRKATLDVLREANAAAKLSPAVIQEIDDLRRVQDESGARTHETLTVVHETLERVVDRLAAFEDELTELRAAPPASGFAREAAPPAAMPAAAIKLRAEPPLSEQAPQRRGVEVEDLDLADLGGPAPGAAQRGAAGAAPTDFIAAARRAAQRAAAEADAAQSRQGARRAAGEKDDAAEASSPLAEVGARLSANKRPILLGLAMLVMLGSAYQMAHLGLFPSSGSPPGARTAAATAPAEGQKPPTRAEDAAPQKPASSILPPPQLLPPPASAAPGSGDSSTPAKPPGKTALDAPTDKTPTGSIGNPASEELEAIKQAAKRGEANAQYEYAARLAEGRGVARDPKTAAVWFEKAAAQGLALAQYRLGSLYEKGVGVDRDYGKAKSWYQQAAENGNARAMHNLAVLFAEGEDGKPDYGAASDWFRRAAEFGVRDSQYNLAILYARGLGVGQSLVQSYMWFAVAANQGDQDAGKKREEVGSRLDSKELAKAKELVNDFKPRQPKREANEAPAAPFGGWGGAKAQTLKPEVKPYIFAPTGKPKVSAL